MENSETGSLKALKIHAKLNIFYIILYQYYEENTSVQKVYFFQEFGEIFLEFLIVKYRLFW